MRDGWQKVNLEAVGLRRELLWKEPEGGWRNGAIIVLHGGGSKAAHFCGGELLVGPQTRFAKTAVALGFAVFALEATDDKVTDAWGRTCGKRFDFSVLSRANLDLPYVEKVIGQIIPERRPANSSKAVFMVGLSTGGYMTIRASTHFDDKITAFATVSAGDPYGTDTNCDPSLSPRESAKGILLDRETRKHISQLNACYARHFQNEAEWSTANPRRKPSFKQFHHRADGIVDISCMRKATELLQAHGYRSSDPYVLTGERRSADKHLWLDEYNQPLLDYFASEAARRVTDNAP